MAVRKRRTVGVKRKDVIAAIVEACPDLDIKEAAALGLVASLFKDIEIRHGSKVIIIRDARICAIGHQTKNR